MIKDNQKRLNQFHIVLDICVIALAYVSAYYIFFSLLRGTWLGGVPNGVVTQEIYFTAIPFVVVLMLILNAVFHLYQQPKRVSGRRLEFSNIVKASVLGTLIIIAILWLMPREGRLGAFYMEISRKFLVWFCVLNILFLTVERNILRLILMYARKSGFNQKHVLIVGYSRTAEAFIDRVKANPQRGYQLRGILDDTMPRGKEYKGVRVISNLSNLEAILDINRLDEVVIALGLSEYKKLESIVNSCEKVGVHTKFIPDYNNIIPTKPYTEDLLGLPVVHIRHVPLMEGFNRVVKRTMDIVGSIACIILFSPVMLITAIAVKVTSPGPLIYKQERVGLHNRPFKMYKFRSMEVQTAKEEQGKWTTPNDPRVTNVGKFIRKTSIDELPQLFNVLVGDMSLVGPRPERPFFVEKFKEEIPRYMVKHQVRPGMTGWAQVNGYRGDTSIRKRIDHDLYYIENWTLGFDFKILFLTVFKGFINKNAY